jgi:hypothetical protein
MKEAYIACFLQKDFEIAIRSSWSSFFLHKCNELAERSASIFLQKRIELESFNEPAYRNEFICLIGAY